MFAITIIIIRNTYYYLRLFSRDSSLFFSDYYSLDFSFVFPSFIYYIGMDGS